MNNKTRKIIITLCGIAGASASAISVIKFSGMRNIPGLVLLSTLAGTLGNLAFTRLGTLLMSLERRLTRGHPSDMVFAFGRFPVEETIAASAGGKGRVLAKLYQEGYSVPDGCILLPGAFSQGDLNSESWIQVKKQLSRLRAGRQISFAVRSSALQEDSARASFAGAFESVLDVRSDEEIREAVRVVLKSGQSARVQSYSQAQGLAGNDHPVAVVVQKLIQPDFAGVLFTADPLTGNLGQMTGNFVTGIGEKLVSGQVSALTFTIDRPQGIYHGPTELDPIAKSLHRTAHDIENELGCPQDIEWAVTGKKLFILQARPITTLNGYNSVTAVWNESLKGNFLWSATNMMEASPEVLTPFTVSLRYYLDKHGGPTMSVKNYSLNGIIGGRFYANITVQVSAFARLFKGDARRAYRELSGWWGDIPKEMEIPVLPLTGEDWTKRVLPGLWRSNRQFGKYRKLASKFITQNRLRCVELCEKIRQEKTKKGLAALWNTEIYPLYRDSLYHIVSASSDIQVRLERELRDLVDPEDANALLSNLSGLSGQLESLGPVAGLGMIQRGEMTREAYLESYGHRGVNECECAWPRPAEDPDWLDRQLVEWARTSINVDTLLTRQRAAYEAAWKRFCQQQPHRMKAIQKRIQQAAKTARQREAVRSESTRVTTAVRAFALHAGKMLGIGEDVFFLAIDEVLEALASSTESAALRYVPLRKETYQQYHALPPYPALICGRFDPFEWAADPNRRSDVYDAGIQLTPPTVTDDQDTNTIHGFPGALGIVEGTVHRLDSMNDSDQFQAGEVLVTTMTNIGWTPIFPRATAIVTDLGAPLSHAAIVARELGIPAVVGCGDATMRLKTGDRVRVDGGKGLVQILCTKF
ncbi:MAG: PEP/pyruvate-binding domain-containing protein [Flexilinea sp.]